MENKAWHDKIALRYRKRATKHDWPDDYDHENGMYSNGCFSCGTTFIGHKRRACCKACATKAENLQPEKEVMEAPKPLYPCMFRHCAEEFSWPAEDLTWVPHLGGWVCDNCWADNHTDHELGPTLDKYLAGQVDSRIKELDEALTMICEERDEYHDEVERLTRRR